MTHLSPQQPTQLTVVFKYYGNVDLASISGSDECYDHYFSN